LNLTKEFCQKLLETSFFNAKIWELRLGTKVLLKTPVYVENGAFWGVRVPPQMEIKIKRKDSGKELAWWCDDVKIGVLGTTICGTTHVTFPNGNRLIDAY
jgi:hypothetical protein